MGRKPKEKLSFNCEKCGGKLKIMQAGKRTGLYCSKCGSWARWIKHKTDVSAAYNELITKDDIRGKAIKKIIKYGRNTIILCEKCDCQLHSASAPKPIGQFDLINASFCPRCGVEFIDDNKKLKK